MSFYFAWYCDAQQKAEDVAAQHPVSVLFITITVTYVAILLLAISKQSRYSKRKKIIIFTILIILGLILFPAYIITSLMQSPHLCDS
jgi:glucan phosphoethanolaminetransferase (alkaline phosphatase superfamily)